jgi:tetratricopeptide (TPR) repeat protein
VLPFLIVFTLLLALLNSDNKGIEIYKPASMVLSFLALLFVSISIYNRYPTYEAYRKWKEAGISYDRGNYKSTSGEYGKIYPELSDQIRFLLGYAQTLSKSGQYQESNDVLEKAVKISCTSMLYNIMGKNHQGLKQYAEAERCFRKAANIVPNRVYPYYLLALMYAEAGETEKAKAMAHIVLTKEPKVQSTAIREMREEMKGFINAD